MPHMNAKESSKKQLIIYLSLLIISIFFSIFHYPFVLGISFNFSYLFLFMLMYLFRLKYAAPSILLIQISSYTFIHDTPLLLIISLLEMMTVGILIKRFKKLNLFISELLFWVIAAPAIYALLQQLGNQSDLNEIITPLFVAVLVMNGLFNALMADAFVTFLPFNKWMSSNKTIPYSVRVFQILFHLVAGVVFVSFMVNAVINTTNGLDRIQNSFKQLAATKINGIFEQLTMWEMDDLHRLQLNGIIQTSILHDVIQSDTENEEIYTVITNKAHQVLASTAPGIQENEPFDWRDSEYTSKISSQLYESTSMEDRSKSSIQNYGSGYLIYEQNFKMANLNIIILYPNYLIQKQIFADFMQHFRFIFIFAICSLLLALAINRLFVQPLHQLSRATTKLPERLEHEDTISWPKTFISELSVLIENFMHMSAKLKNTFKEMNSLNKTLEMQAKDLKKSEKKLYEYAFYDPLTGLPNRLYFQQHLTKLITEKKQTTDMIAILFLDLNRFKQVNDTLGHEAGDSLLKIISARLQSLITDEVAVFRLGGDEFVIVIDSVTKKKVEKETERLLALFKDPITLKGQALYISGSVGVSLYPEDGQDIDTLVKNADMAMYSSKEEGDNQATFFMKKMEESLSNKMLLDHGLHEALRLQQFEIYYQPKINGLTGTLSGMEALIRWNHPKQGLISPATFIPIAEELGLIIEIDQWMIYKACHQNKQWQDLGYPKIPVAVNMSAKHLRQPNLLTHLEWILQQSKLDPTYLKIEITESALIQDIDNVIDKIKQIHSLGISISIDDFGIGYSSLNQLLHLPIQEIKLDQMFIRGIHLDKKKAAIVKMVVSLAQELQLNVVAEGIENKEELKLLRDFKINEVQGYFYSKPLNKEHFTQYLFASQNDFKEKKV